MTERSAADATTPRRRSTHRLPLGDPEVQEFWAERHLATLTTLTSDGRPHTVPVAPVLDADNGALRILASRRSRKVRNVTEAGDEPWVSVCQVDGRRWCTANGTAEVLTDDESVQHAEKVYAERFRVPRPNPERVVLFVTIDHLIGSL
ncbi:MULTISPECIES: pyridoxamine 5'-phosphate oxidase family protein [Flexivirga]|uniref:PPOX class F420-dependent enzyme n=1 Tax=Flexivirga endophytica TaxID=1849103 RepID=A0A916T0F3_9MICO|nr:TIGR03618 family F420-dependent PPOX class oxidoreductase [Flexivirga endophytica]GGB24369.1 PPOX class F420-dependent enzyme [Flexivirga endophytica]GHB63066.1 PPOX class F420-dependent enzyme [Flexivirga endophytica]